MADHLFRGLPPPASSTQGEQPSSSITMTAEEYSQNPPPFFLKSALKRAKVPASEPQVTAPVLKSALKRTTPPNTEPEAAAPEKRLRFKMMTDASETQVIDAMKKIASHIKNSSKFSKASKLAIQLIQAGSVKPGTSDHFFAILEAAMLSPAACNDPAVRDDYRALFLAAQDSVECLNEKQRSEVNAWTTRAVVANDLFTDDSFVFSKASSKIKEAISNLPVATKNDDTEEAAALKGETEAGVADRERNGVMSSSPEANDTEESDPFWLDALIPSASKKDGKGKGKNDAAAAKARKEEANEAKRFLKLQREALILCLEIAANRYKVPWCQTVIDILVKHAFDNVSRFTSKQRDAIEKVWVSIKEQETRRKQGKSVSGKLDVNAFEWLQQKYANEKISIRHSVGGSTRRAEQWLG